MKSVKELINEMDRLCKTEEEKLHPVIDYCAVAPKDPLPDCNCDCDGNEFCNPVKYCCVITVPAGFTFSGNPGDIKVGVVDKCCTLVPGEECCKTVCGCRMKFQKFDINTCLDVRVSIKVEDPCGNETYLCCCDCVCYEGTALCCKSHCYLPMAQRNGNFEHCLCFEILDKYAVELADACIPIVDAAKQAIPPKYLPKTVWEISGLIGFSCDPDCPPTIPAP